MGCLRLWSRLHRLSALLYVCTGPLTWPNRITITGSHGHQIFTCSAANARRRFMSSFPHAFMTSASRTLPWNPELQLHQRRRPCSRPTIKLLRVIVLSTSACGSFRRPRCDRPGRLKSSAPGDEVDIPSVRMVVSHTRNAMMALTISYDKGGAGWDYGYETRVRAERRG
ncbi:hypothetical protein MPH_11017 [Macrophomina phaseolina MS6]|uniref:Uncharacterized protein n=1 Tax=Macrophomina phaseolina (strain MS6) TaxID=1126212 RepID=K2S572_MACPH|nr:hypothetical protein MPH_11017 [Macrophomina phaseolina MS6]